MNKHSGTDRPDLATGEETRKWHGSAGLGREVWNVRRGREDVGLAWTAEGPGDHARIVVRL